MKKIICVICVICGLGSAVAAPDKKPPELAPAVALEIRSLQLEQANAGLQILQLQNQQIQLFLG